MAPHHETFLAIEAIHALEIDHDAFAPQQHVESFVAKARPEPREFFEPIANRRIAQRTLRSVMPARAGKADKPHRPARTHVIGGSQMGDDPPPLFRRHHLRPATSLSIAMSSA